MTGKYLASIVLLLVAGVCLAQDGLYAPSVPEDAALVRVVNATPEERTMDVGPERFADVGPFSATAYRAFRGDVVVLMHAGAREVLTPQPGAFLTVVLRPEGLAVVLDERHTDPARAQVVIYNLTASPVDFAALEPQATLVSEVAAGSSARRVVNAIAVRLGAVREETVLFEASLELERGESYSIFVLGADSQPQGFVARASITTE